MDKIKKFYQQNRALSIIFIVALAYYLQRLITFRLGMFFEESRDANAYLFTLQGHLPYRDFDWIYGPFAFFIYPFIMKICGINLIVLRISYIIFGSLAIPLTYFLAARIMPHFWAGIAAFLSVVFFRVPYYTFNHVFAVLGELGCLLMVCRFMESDKRISNLFWAGIFAAIALLTKPILPGIALFVSISLFLLLFSELGPRRKRFKDYSVFAIATVSLVLLYFLYFYSQTKLKNIAITHSYFAPDSILFAEILPSRVNLGVLPFSIKRLVIITPIIRQIIHLTLFTDFKKSLIDSFDNFILALPFISTILILLIYTASKFNKARPEIKEKIYGDKRILSLFIIFSLLISLERLMTNYVTPQAFVNQLPLILSAYILYLIKKVYAHRPVITNAFIALFLFSLTFLDFFWYPYSVIKRYTKPLNLERAKGVLVTKGEKEVYESLSAYLALNLDRDDKIAVMGYFPNISFLTKQENIFEKDGHIFPKLGYILTALSKKEKTKMLLTLLEDKIISKMEKERPGAILDVTDNPLGDFEFLTPKIKDYIKKNYSLDKVISPADVKGLGVCASCQVKLYKKEEGRLLDKAVRWTK